MKMPDGASRISLRRLVESEDAGEMHWMLPKSSTDIERDRLLIRLYNPKYPWRQSSSSAACIDKGRSFVVEQRQAMRLPRKTW